MRRIRGGGRVGGGGAIVACPRRTSAGPRRRRAARPSSCTRPTARSTAPAAGSPTRASGVSAHYLVGLDGRVAQFVDEADTARHAGASPSPTRRPEPGATTRTTGRSGSSSRTAATRAGRRAAGAAARGRAACCATSRGAGRSRSTASTSSRTARSTARRPARATSTSTRCSRAAGARSRSLACCRCATAAADLAGLARLGRARRATPWSRSTTAAPTRPRELLDAHPLVVRVLAQPAAGVATPAGTTARTGSACSRRALELDPTGCFARRRRADRRRRRARRCATFLATATRCPASPTACGTCAMWGDGHDPARPLGLPPLRAAARATSFPSDACTSPRSRRASPRARGSARRSGSSTSAPPTRTRSPRGCAKYGEADPDGRWRHGLRRPRRAPPRGRRRLAGPPARRTCRCLDHATRRSAPRRGDDGAAGSSACSPCATARDDLPGLSRIGRALRRRGRRARRRQHRRHARRCSTPHPLVEPSSTTRAATRYAGWDDAGEPQPAAGGGGRARARLGARPRRRRADRRRRRRRAAARSSTPRPTRATPTACACSG